MPLATNVAIGITSKEKNLTTAYKGCGLGNVFKSETAAGGYSHVSIESPEVIESDKVKVAATLERMIRIRDITLSLRK